MKYSFFLSFLYIVTLCSCSSHLIGPLMEQYDPIEIYDEFWTYVDENYIFFDLKDIDWDEQRAIAMNSINPEMSQEELFDVIDASLLALEDNHSRMQGLGRSHTSFNYTEGYDIHFSLDVVEQNYSSTDLDSHGSLRYGILDSGVGYIHFSQMNRYGAFGQIIREMKDQGVIGLAIDVRNNGGGDSNPVPALLSDFTDEEIFLGSYIEKAGPSHDDVTPLLPAMTSATSYDFGLPVVMITNRRGYSATSYFAAMAKEVPSVTVIGQTSGGGGGGNLGYQLSNGWVVAVSVSDFIDTAGSSIEFGVEPDITVVNSETDLTTGIDKMLEYAVDIITAE